MRIANVAVSLPLPGISSGGPYGHPGLARAPPRGRHDREHLQAGSLHGEILMLRQTGAHSNYQFATSPRCASMAGQITAGRPVRHPFRTQHPLGAVVNRPSVWSDRFRARVGLYAEYRVTGG
jgi:hypothetical protein